MKIKFLISAAALFFATAQLNAQCTQVFWTDPSFEGPTPGQPHVLPPGWSNCNGTTSDTQPGNWGITLPASNGSTYAGLVSVPGWEETASQVFSPCLPAGGTYNFSIDIAKIDETSDGGGDCDGWIELWGGGSSGSACDMSQLLWSSPTLVTNGPNQGVWQTYTMTFTPTQTTCQLTFIAKEGNCATGSGDFYVGIDNLGPIGSVNVTPTIANVACGGGNDGSITVLATGGLAPYSYSWSNGGTGATITNLSAGGYTVTVTDANSCVTTYNYTVTEPTPVTATLTPTDINCTNTTGSVATTATGGNGTYSYSWSPSGSGQNPTGLTAGVYTVTVTDGNSCTGTQTVTIGSNTTPPNVSVASGLNIGCGGSGTVNLGGASSTAGATFSWTGPSSFTSTTASPAVSTAGTYSLIVTDPVNGCTSTASVTVTNSTSFSVTPSSQNVLCNGGTTGAGTVTVTGGTGPFNYTWSNSATGATATNLAAGTYTVLVVDAASCSTSVNVVITEPTAIAASLTATSVNCANTTATITSTVTGGSPTYTYAWSPSGSGANPSGLAAGTYTATITDANNCVTTQTVTISSNTTAPNANAGADDTLDCGTTATLNLNASSSTGGVTYSWAGPNGFTSSSQNPSVNAVGAYTVTVTNPANGCTSTDVVNVGQASINASFTATPPSGTYPLHVDFTNTSTNASSYVWSFGNGDNSTFMNDSTNYLANGTYTVTMIASNSFNCHDTVTSIIIVHDQMSILIPNVFSPNGDGSNDLFFILNTGLSSLHVDIFDRWGLKIAEITTPTGGWNGKTTSGHDSADGTYYYMVNAVGVDGVEISKQGYVLLTR